MQTEAKWFDLWHFWHSTPYAGQSPRRCCRPQNLHFRINFRFSSLSSLPPWSLLSFFSSLLFPLVRWWTVSDVASIALFLSFDNSEARQALTHLSRSKSATFKRSSLSFESRIPQIIRSRTSDSRRVVKLQVEAKIFRSTMNFSSGSPSSYTLV